MQTFELRRVIRHLWNSSTLSPALCNDSSSSAGHPSMQYWTACVLNVSPVLPNKTIEKAVLYFTCRGVFMCFPCLDAPACLLLQNFPASKQCLLKTVSSLFKNSSLLWAFVVISDPVTAMWHFIYPIFLLWTKMEVLGTRQKYILNNLNYGQYNVLYDCILRPQFIIHFHQLSATQNKETPDRSFLILWQSFPHFLQQTLQLPSFS